LCWAWITTFGAEIGDVRIAGIGHDLTAAVGVADHDGDEVLAEIASDLLKLRDDSLRRADAALP